MRDKGSASDVATASAALKRRAAELLDFEPLPATTAAQTSYATAVIMSDSEQLRVRFNAVNWLYDGHMALLGSITLADQTLGQFYMPRPISDTLSAVVYKVVTTPRVQTTVTKRTTDRVGSDPSRATAGPGEPSLWGPKHFPGAPLGRTFLNFSF